MAPDDTKADRQRIQLILPVAQVEQIDELCKQLGHRSRGALLERLLDDLFPGTDGQDGDQDGEETGAEEELDSCRALVLVTGQENRLVSPDQGQLGLDELGEPEKPDGLAEAGEASSAARASDPLGPSSLQIPSRRPRNPETQELREAPGPAGIDLPGFVRQSSARLRRSLHPRPAAQGEPLPAVKTSELDQALLAAEEHWLSLYGTAANEAVLEAAMVWLARDIWVQSDQAEGRPFTWALIEQWVTGFVSGWPAGPPSFNRVIVAAGLLEDPFSTDTLTLRVPTLIRRFVHRFRRRRRGTSFQTLEHTMTLQGALKVLALPTAPGHKLSLNQIREAYREQAMSHHPDSGGSADAMRRLNEAYQLLKELYRRPA
ncbi:J domain-containing protein [Synechococcus sp. CS-205]|uniref:J domain-containing protein n=1 Tax=Synechococcus sp. CS-205 TaxID=2847984 RepID=UPI00223B7820|nr:J domain-containing protein [Synechococcus sp. CS-205]MCT0248539.1 J domain-containing protein [Synechococcus sp. CS-205]